MYSKDEKFEMVTWYQNGNSLRTVRDLFSIKYPERPIPCIRTIQKIVTKFKAEGGVIRSPKVRVKISHVLTEEMKLNILCYVEEKPIVSLREIASHFNVSKGSVFKTLKEFKYKTCKFSNHQQLFDEDKEKLCSICSMNKLEVKTEVWIPDTNEPTSDILCWKESEENFQPELNAKVKEESFHQILIKEEAPDVECDPDTTYNIDSIKLESLHQELDLKTESLSNHLTTHTVERPFRCSTCSHTSTGKSTLNPQMNIHIGNEPFKCSTSSFTRIKKCKFEQPMKVPTEKPFKCNMCSYASVDKRNFQRHIKTHTGEKPFKCNVCTYASIEKCSLERHMRNHTGEKPFKCNVCSYAGVQKSNLQAHMKIHIAEKPFKCNICSYAGVYKGNLTQHMKIHTGEKTIQV